MSEQQQPTRQAIVEWAAGAYGIDAGKVMGILKSTCFRTAKDEPEATDPEVAALLIVAKAHGLNPFLREIHAFRDKKGGIVPVVGVDGWARILNQHPEFDGVELKAIFEADKFVGYQCTIYRKDRSHPTVVSEYLSECRRDTGPWKSHPQRMTRHKSLMQCGRVAFSFAGIFDEDEAEAIVAGSAATLAPVSTVRSGTERMKNAMAVGQPKAIEHGAGGADDDFRIPTAIEQQREQETIDQTTGEIQKESASPASGPTPEASATDEASGAHGVADRIITIVECIQKLEEFTDMEVMALWADSLDNSVKVDARFTKAYRKAMNRIKGKD